MLVADALVSGEEDLTNDAGIFQPASLGNLAFVDVDGDGTFTSGVDTPLENVLVELLDEDGNPVLDGNGDALTATTGPNGLYSFCLLYTSPSPRDGLLSRMPSSA